jgi:nitrogen fixation NifU-like protein
MHNPSCGDKILLKLNVQNGKIKDVCFEGYGCALSTASASMLTEHVKGLTLEQAKSLKVQDVITLLDIEVSSARSKCASLPFEALQEAIKSQME